MRLRVVPGDRGSGSELSGRKVGARHPQPTPSPGIRIRGIWRYHPGSMGSEALHLRVLVADGPGVRFDEVTRTVADLGHDVIARESSLLDVARMTAAEHPDVAIVIVHDESPKALGLIDRIVHEASCPVIAVLDVQDRAFINEAAQRGIFAYVAHGHDPQEMQSAIDIVLRRFAEYHALEGAFGRRAVTERAKGILWSATTWTKRRRSRCSEIRRGGRIGSSRDRRSRGHWPLAVAGPNRCVQPSRIAVTPSTGRGSRHVRRA